ncbi:hypothetical protein [Streptomyces sp. FH025]|uniref:hypothetical protein n=1 Tax=Streptomyces sp. FH025 TaxID=2815937 RepID=UPI001A9D0973|nr:hypothetical protein [Streptomyces sp. FH025]MBO1418012.1 hypothetical protein [Streptomyces sp. FH025]
MNPSGPALPNRPRPYKLRIRHSRRWKAGVTVIAFASAMAVVHLLEHWHLFTLTTVNLDDALFGWPAAVLAGLGAVVMGRD